MSRFELTRFPLLKRLLKNRWLQWALMIITLPFFVLAILASLFGTPAGNRNFGIVFVWIVWWALVILFLVPAAGRLWCAMCPIPAPGEWLQRRSFIRPHQRGKLFSLGRKWPKRLNNMWLQNFSFLGVALFSAVILTTPLVSGLVLAAFVLVAIASSLLYERRVFCRYLCPVGGFIGLYSQIAPIELRVKDPQVCVGHKEKTCYIGSEAGYGCPWLVLPATLQKNTYCGLCTECLKTCPLDNLALYTRPVGADLTALNGRRMDEAYKGFIMLTCALAYSLVLTGPWALLKETAFAVASPAWFLYAVAFLTANLVIVPGVFALFVEAGKRLGKVALPSRKLFVDYAYTLVPLGLAAWCAFSLSFVLVNFSYAWPVLSDPLGWGWNLLGTADWHWTPYLPGLIPYLQVPVLMTGLFGAIRIALRTATGHQALPRTVLPVVTFCTLFTLALLVMYVG